MAKLKEIATGRKDIFMIDPRLLQVRPGWNPRHDTPELQAHIRWLADSIKEKGVEEPLTISQENEVIYVDDGHNRRAACLLAIAEGVDIKAVPCMPAGRYDSAADKILGLITRNSGLPLTLLEKADVFKRLLGQGWTLAEIAQKSGYSQKHVENTLELLTLPADVKDMVVKGEVSATLAGETAPEALRKAKAEGKARVTKKDVEKNDDKLWRPEGFAHPAIALVYDLTAEIEDAGDRKRARKIEKLALKLEAMLWQESK